jgi:membrane associated rhomboid family serine protease
LSYSLAAANAAVWVAWRAPSENVKIVMQSFFTSGGDVARGRLSRVLSPLLACYSHSSLIHLAVNMAALLSFAPRIIEDHRGASSPRQSRPPRPRLSPLEFLAMYNVAGVGSALASSIFTARVGTSRPGLGASGCIFSVFAFYAQALPESRVLLFFVIEMSAQSALALSAVVNSGLAVKEVLAAQGRARPPLVDGVAHLVGTFVGLAWFEWARLRQPRDGAPSTRAKLPPSKSRVVIPVAPGSRVDV